ncbi:MAG TPA: redoxin domain-containing protein [Chloroflexota bacterium]|nr:redoxin domain-containing protein [Chloroflexota bacterium]
MTQFGLDADEFKRLDAEVIASSIDSPFVLDQFDKATNFGWNLISDFNREIGPAYDSLNESLGNGMKGVHKRTVFVIDREGTVRYKWESEGGSLPNDEDIMDVIRKL